MSPLEEVLKRANKLEQFGQRKLAIRLLKEYLETTGTSPLPLLVTLGRLYRLNGDPEKAVYYLETALGLMKREKTTTRRSTGYNNDAFDDDDMAYIDEQSQEAPDEEYHFETDVVSLSSEDKPFSETVPSADNCFSQNQVVDITQPFHERASGHNSTIHLSDSEHVSLNAKQSPRPNEHLDHKHSCPIKDLFEGTEWSPGGKPTTCKFELSHHPTRPINESIEKDTLPASHKYPEDDTVDDVLDEHFTEEIDDFEISEDDDFEISADIDDFDYLEDLDEFDEDARQDIASEQITEKLTESLRAQQVAAEVLEHAGWPVEHLKLLQIIFEAHGWGACRRAIENLIALGISPHELKLAHEIRQLWSQSEKYWITFRPVKRNVRYQETSASYKNLSWVEALRIIRAFHSIPTIDEVHTFIDDTYEIWYNNAQLRKYFKEFLSFIKFQVRHYQEMQLDPASFSLQWTELALTYHDTTEFFMSFDMDLGSFLDDLSVDDLKCLSKEWLDEKSKS